ncbi:MAG: methylmalonyl Co-A mutase-associated GTPase MeaB [Calditrichaceae bacterium]
MTPKKQKPEWAPVNPDESFASNVVGGVEGGHDGMSGNSDKRSENAVHARKSLNTEDYVKGVLNGDRTVLGRAITLVESNAQTHKEQAREVLKQLLPHTGKSIRIGISGVPGSGKSTFIESLGIYLIEQGFRVAVLAIDPSSSIKKGSILGDKTRMEKLSRNPGSFIRPSPSGGTLGGVAGKTRETMLVCEAAGYDVLLIETVGVGQSEITVRSMVDFFLLLQIAGAGDELQGIKKGVMEIADAVLINKADGDNKSRAEAAKQDFAMALHYQEPATEGWEARVHTCSAITGQGISEIWNMIEEFREVTNASGVFERRRRLQARDWMNSLVQEQLKHLFLHHPEVEKVMKKMEDDVMAGNIPPAAAADYLLKLFENSLKR